MTGVERAFPALLQDFFHRRLVAQRGASAHTIASYRTPSRCFSGTPQSAPDAPPRH